MSGWRRLASGDVLSGLALAALGAFIVQQALGWEYLTPEGPGAGFFPRWYGVAIVVLSLALVVSGLRKRASTEHAHEVSYRRVLACWAALVGCVLLTKPLGFLASFALLCWLISTMLFGRPQRSAIPFALGAAIAFWLVFAVALGVSLPRGLWEA